MPSNQIVEVLKPAKSATPSASTAASASAANDALDAAVSNAAATAVMKRFSNDDLVTLAQSLLQPG